MCRVGLIFNKKNIAFNIDNLDINNNILYVTGLSGSGKTTFAKLLAKKYNCILFELDNLGGFWDEYRNSKELIHTLTNDFLNHNQELKEIIRLGNFVSLKIEKFEEYLKWINKYIDFLENYAHKQNKLFIFEGTQLFKCINVSHFLNKPFIVVGTSSLCSCIRRLRRHYKIDKSNNRKYNYFKKHIWKLLHDSKRLHLHDFKCLNQFLKIINTNNKQIVSDYGILN